MDMQVIARIRNGYQEKFGIPRQAGLVNTTLSEIVMEKPFRDPDCLRGLEEFSHLWIIWYFDRNGTSWEKTVRPPRLGGNIRKGVFATRSPYRPNRIGMSCVEIEEIQWKTPEGPKIIVRGADLMDQTAILDLKPYIPYTDAHPFAKGSFSDEHQHDHLRVLFPEKVANMLEDHLLVEINDILAQDPRPGYQDDPERIYGILYHGYNVRFQVNGQDLNVIDIQKV